MKSTTLALGLMAGLASAAVPRHPRYHHMYPRANVTTYPTYPAGVPQSVSISEGPSVTAGPSTTLTIGVTTTHVITSCAPTVTNCPVGHNGTAVVTEVVDITTVVCPVSNAPQISSSVISDYSKGVITGVTSTVRPTGSSPSGAYPTAPAPPGAIVTPSTGVTDQTLTMTVGPSNSRSVVITTIKSTYTEMHTVTVPAGGQGGNATPTGQPTTTLTSTSTGTRTVTVKKPSTTDKNSAEATNPVKPGAHGGISGGNGDSSDTCVPVTVTVTQPAATVYVTVAPSSTSKNSAYPTGPAAVQAPQKGNDNGKGGEEEDDDECPAESAEAASSKPVVTATATLVPYPTGPNNGTHPTFPAPTGGVSVPSNSYPTIPPSKPRDLFNRH